MYLIIKKRGIAGTRNEKSIAKCRGNKQTKLQQQSMTNSDTSNENNNHNSIH